MNPQEREQLTRFLNQLAEARISEKNPEADALIREAVAKQPDAAYLLVQRAMLVDQALNSAKAQIAQLQAGQSAGKSSFLGGSNPWASPLSNSQNSAGVPGANEYQLPRAAAPLASAGGASSFLGNVATTAAGVVAGSFLFQGIENLLGHHQPSSSWTEPTGDRMSEQTIVNNYYDSEQGDAWQSQDNGNAFLASDTGSTFLDDDELADGGDDSNWV